MTRAKETGGWTEIGCEFDMRFFDQVEQPSVIFTGKSLIVQKLCPISTLDFKEAEGLLPEARYFLNCKS